MKKTFTQFVLQEFYVEKLGGKLSIRSVRQITKWAIIYLYSTKNVIAYNDKH